MSNDQRTPNEELDLRVAQHQRQGWSLVWRRHDPPRARMRKVQRGPRRLPLGMVFRTKEYGDRTYCRDIAIGDDGKATWGNVPCDSDDPAT